VGLEEHRSERRRSLVVCLDVLQSHPRSTTEFTALLENQYQFPQLWKMLVTDGNRFVTSMLNLRILTQRSSNRPCVERERILNVYVANLPRVGSLFRGFVLFIFSPRIRQAFHLTSFSGTRFCTANFYRFLSILSIVASAVDLGVG
jgi:hypothetical protein